MSETGRIDRLRAAIDEVEATAREAWQENWRWYAEDNSVMTHADADGEWDRYRQAGTKADARHIAPHDPDTTLRRVAVDRKLVDMCEREIGKMGENAEAEARGWLMADVFQLMIEAYGVTGE